MFPPILVYSLALQAVVDQSSYNQLHAGLETFVQESDQKATGMRQSGYDFADLAEDLRQFAKGTVQRGSTHLDNDMVETTSRAVKDLADKIDGVAQIWGDLRSDTILFKEQLTSYVDPNISVTKVRRCCVQ